MLEMRGVSKAFAGVRALHDVSFDVDAGEVHALVGENGAGKSTLMKILSGAYTEYTGELFLDGEPLTLSSPRDAQRHGIAIIYQELNLIPELTVAENIFLGRELRRSADRSSRSLQSGLVSPAPQAPQSKQRHYHMGSSRLSARLLGAAGLLDTRTMHRAARELLDRLGLKVSTKRSVKELRVGEQQLVEVAKALSLDARLLILDEPTSALSDAEIHHLFDVIAGLKAHGVASIYISHKFDEVFAIADRITVLRDGQYVATMSSAETNQRELIRMMVGRPLSDLFPRTDAPVGDEVLRVDDLQLVAQRRVGTRSVGPVSFMVRRGEIVGIAGLLGAGRTELLEALFGVHHRRVSGRVVIAGDESRLRSPRAAIAAGLAFVTEDRKTQSLIMQMSVRHNVTLAALRRYLRFDVLRRRAEDEAVKRSIEQLRIKTPSRGAPVETLSGGNQQKVALAKCLLTEPDVLLLDEPTRGIDVGAKAEIYALISELAHRGAGIVMASSELPELLAMCDRILVLCEGALTAELSRAEATQERIMEAATSRLPAEGAA